MAFKKAKGKNPRIRLLERLQTWLRSEGYITSRNGFLASTGLLLPFFGSSLQRLYCRVILYLPPLSNQWPPFPVLQSLLAAGLNGLHLPTLTSLSRLDSEDGVTQGGFMLYRRSLEIGQRLDAALRLIRSGRYSTPGLAEQLGVSIPTVSRYVTALRERGYDIRAEKQARGWRYFLAGAPAGRPKRLALPFAEGNQLPA